MVAVNRKHPLAEVSGPAHMGAAANEVACIRAKITLPADHELNDTYDLVKLPAECRVVDAVMVCGDLDANGAPAITLDVGVIDTVQDPSDTTDTDAFFAAVTTGQAGGVVRATLATAFNVATRSYDRTVRLLVKVAAATPQAGNVELLLYVSPKQANSMDSAQVMAT